MLKGEILVNNILIFFGILLLAILTFITRLSGVFVRERNSDVDERVTYFSNASALVLLMAVVVSGTFYEGDSLADLPRILAVGVAGVLSYLKQPFIVVVLCAAAVAAILRLFM